MYKNFFSACRIRHFHFSYGGRINVIVFLFLLQTVAIKALPQSVNIKLSIKNETVENVIKSIQKQTGCEFAYDRDLLHKRIENIHLDIKNGEIEQVLKEVFGPAGISYLVKGNKILLFTKEKPDAASSMQKSMGNLIRVTGTVSDTTGITLAGVTIMVKGKQQGTSTDLNGLYVIEVPVNSVLVFSYVGFKPVERTVTKNSNILNVVLKEDNAVLDEVMVVGYGVQKKISMIGSQSTIQTEELKIPVRNLTTSLGGRVAGLISVQRKGEPGYDDGTIYIRGISTFSSALSAPLTLVDGVPRSFSDVDPEDIESFSILKDASATAVYGVRGANGVILITTKSGKAGRPKFKIRYTEGITKFTQLPDFADGPTYMRMSNEAVTTRGGNPVYTPEQIEMTAQGTDPYLYPNVDWFKEIYNKFGHVRNANININGGSDRSTYYVSLGYYDELGLYKTDELNKYNNSAYYKRYNVTANLTLKPTNTTTVKLGIQGYLAHVNIPGSSSENIFSSAYQETPIIVPVTYPDGKIADVRGGSVQNPYGVLTQFGYANQWRNQIFSNLRVTQDLPFLLKGLSITGMFSFDAYNYSSARFTKTPDAWYATGRDENGELILEQTHIGSEFLSYGKSVQGTRNLYGEAALNYNVSIKEHDITAMLLYNQSDEVNTQATALIDALPRRYKGLAGRATYAYNDKYFLEANFGYNGSENFLPKKRYGFFPSVGLGWVISGEKFFTPLQPYIQFLKIRATHGKVGNSNISGRRFAYIATVSSPTGYSFGKNMNNNYGGKEIGEYAVDVTWETSKKTNVGADVTILDNKFNIQLDFFKEHREGIFLRRASLPGYVGMINAPYGNIGIIDNKGMDVSVNYANNWGDFFFQMLGNFSFNRNEVVEDDNPQWKYPWLERKGQRVGQRFGYVALGLFESDEEVKISPKQTGDTRAGDIKYKDINGDGAIDSYDQVPIGYGSIPEINYGFGLTLGYKAVSLTALFQGVAHVDIMMSGEGVMPFSQGLSRGNLFSNIVDRWTEENPSQKVFYPRLMDGTLNDNYAASTWWLKSGRYLRLKNVQLTYALPKHFLKKFGCESAEIFLQGVNVLTFTPFKLWDIELGDGRGAQYPPTSSYSIGFNLNF